MELAKKRSKPISCDLSYAGIEDAMEYLGREENAMWILSVPSQLMDQACMITVKDMWMEISFWHNPDTWALKKMVISNVDGVYTRTETVLRNPGA